MLNFAQIYHIQEIIRKDQAEPAEFEHDFNQSLLDRGEYVYSINFDHYGNCEMHVQSRLMRTLLGDYMPKYNPINPSADQQFEHEDVTATFSVKEFMDSVGVAVNYPEQHVSIRAYFNRDELLRILESVPYNYEPAKLKQLTNVTLFNLMRGGDLL